MKENNGYLGISAGALALELGYSIAGDADAWITGISYADEAKPGDLAVAFSKRQAEKTAAEVVLTGPHLLPVSKTYLFAIEDVNLAMLRAAAILIDQGICPDYSALPSVEPNGVAFMGQDVQLGERVSVGPCAVICSGASLGNDCVIGANAYIGAGVYLGDRVRIAPGARLGVDSFYHSAENGILTPFAGIGHVIVGHDVVIGSNTTIQRGTISDTIIGHHTQIGNLVEIGHDVKIGVNCKIVSQTGIAGNAVIGNHVQIFGQSGVVNFVHIGDYAVIKAQSMVTKSVKPGDTILGAFGRKARQELRIQAKLNQLEKRGE